MPSLWGVLFCVLYFWSQKKNIIEDDAFLSVGGNGAGEVGNGSFLC